MWNRQRRGTLAACASVLVLLLAGAAYVRHRAADRRTLDQARARRGELLDRVSKRSVLVVNARTSCEALLAEARARRKEIALKGDDVPPSANLFGVPTAREPLRAHEPGAGTNAFGPYVCTERELPSRVSELLATDPAGAADRASGALSEAEMLLDREDDLARRPELAPTLADWSCSQPSGGYAARCVASWWTTKTGEVVARVYSSTYLGTQLGHGDPPGDLAVAVERAFASTRANPATDR
ncbi:MAG: hypothetical protein JWM74_2081 [Myxococcaceae bacterium]|nr:hypothetical protein [Myxococcaceae bacterium]